VPGVIDGRRWLRQRIEHLEAELQSGPTEAERVQLQAQLDQARDELRRSRLRRWLFWGTPS
jgi:hypothetical protein